MFKRVERQNVQSKEENKKNKGSKTKQIKSE